MPTYPKHLKLFILIAIIFVGVMASGVVLIKFTGISRQRTASAYSGNNQNADNKLSFPTNIVVNPAVKSGVAVKAVATVAPVKKTTPHYLVPPFTKKSSKAEKFQMPILMYHYTEPEKAGEDAMRRQLTVTPEIFEKQLVDLKTNRYKTYFFSEIPDILNGKISPAKKSVVLTFDDGYRDFYYYALPLLKKYNMKATAFIIYNAIGGGEYMDNKRIKALIESGLVEIGSHTLDHKNLRTVDPAEAKRQIYSSKAYLEKDYNLDIKSFAYPYGDISDEALKLVKGAGYTSAASVIFGTEQSTDNLFYLSRVRPGSRVGKDLIDYINGINN